MAEIGIGIVGGGYMGKAHAVPMSAVGAVIDTHLRPRLELVCAASAGSAERHRAAYGLLGPRRTGRISLATRGSRRLDDL